MQWIIANNLKITLLVLCKVICCCVYMGTESVLMTLDSTDSDVIRELAYIENDAIIHVHVLEYPFTF